MHTRPIPTRPAEAEKRGGVFDGARPLLDPTAAARPFAAAVRHADNLRLRGEALRDVRDVALAGLGIGAGGRGLLGLIRALRRRRRPDPRNGPAELALPIPVKAGGFLDGGSAATKSGIPWYGPAAALAVLGGAGVGWKGIDSVLDRQRESARKEELERARREFHDAMLAQYDRPETRLGLPGPGTKAAADADAMRHAGRQLDALYDALVRIKAGLDLGDLAGKATGAYGTYAGLSALMAGALVYDAARKRSRRSVIEKAIQRRSRRLFAQQPPEIYARPEPVPRSDAEAGR